MDSAAQNDTRAALEWLMELGADEAICDAPVDRRALPARMPSLKAVEQANVAQPVATIPSSDAGPVEQAEAAAAAATSLEGLRTAMAAFDHCELKKGARNLVFSDGIPGAQVMLVGEAPGRDEDLQGKPFVGRAGQMLDRMLDAVDLGRDRPDAPVYITNVLPWRPPQNRDPKPEEIAMMKPFLMQHIKLAAPQVLVLVGNWACQTLIGRTGITRLRGEWQTAAGLPALPIFHPAFLLRQPARKREAWADLLSLKARLKDL